MKTVLKLFAVLVVLFGLIQLVPYGRAHTNPPIKGEPAWDSPQTRALAVRACFDCHANTTTWPWYSNVAPISWFLQHHVDAGRARLNFTEWDAAKPPRAARHAAQAVETGVMPLSSYLWEHPTARLTTEETAALAKGLRAMFGD